MTINETMQKIGWGLEDFVSGAYDAMKHTAGSRNAKNAAFTTFFMAPALAIVAPYACAPGDDGGGNGGDSGAKPTDDPKDPVPGDNPTYDFEQIDGLKPFYTQQVADLTAPLNVYGVNVDNSYSFSMSDIALVEAYKNDPDFNLGFNNVFRPVILMLNPSLTPTQADSKVENLVNSLSNNVQTDLKDGQSMFFGYIPDGRGYIAMFVDDEQGNPSVLVAVDNDPIVFNGTTTIPNITALVDFIMNDANYGGGI